MSWPRLLGREQRGQAHGAAHPRCCGWLGEKAHVSQSRSAGPGPATRVEAGERSDGGCCGAGWHAAPPHGETSKRSNTARRSLGSGASSAKSGTGGRTACSGR
eukprot:scaffold13895_cov68-Phaeocystis_antarctica.AAC.4